MIMLSRDGEAGEILEGGRVLLAKLRSHTLPINTRRYEFQSSKQKRGEEFATWWEKKTAMAELCDLGTMLETDFLTTHLMQGVHDIDIKKNLLYKIEDNLSGITRLPHM